MMCTIINQDNIINDNTFEILKPTLDRRNSVVSIQGTLLQLFDWTRKSLSSVLKLAHVIVTFIRAASYGYTIRNDRVRP